VRIFAASNLALVAVWLFVAWRIIKEYDVLKAMKERGELPDDPIDDER
jgi:hypothetical protein